MKRSFCGCTGKLMLGGQYEVNHNQFVVICQSWSFFVFVLGAPIAQWVKCWPTDLVVVSSSPV